MEQGNQNIDITRFNIIFEKLEEAKKEQDINFNLELETLSETSKTILLFKEYQESFVEPNFTTFTKS